MLDRGGVSGGGVVGAPGSGGLRHRLLVLGPSPEDIEPVVALLEGWGADPLVLFDAPAAMNALVRTRPYLVVLDSRFPADLSGLLGVLQGDRALPADARRAVPTLVLTGPGEPPPPIEPGMRVASVRRDRPVALEAALREALQIAGLSSYAPLAFAPAPVPSAPLPASRATPASPAAADVAPAAAGAASRGTAVASAGTGMATTPTSMPRRRRSDLMRSAVLALGMLVLLIPVVFLLLRWPAVPRQDPQASGTTAPVTPVTPVTPGASAAPTTSTAPGTSGVTPGTSSTAPGASGAPGVTGTSTASGQPGAAAAPGTSGMPGGATTPGTSSAPGVIAVATPGAGVETSPGASGGVPGGTSPGSLGGLLGSLFGGAGAPGVARQPWQAPQVPRVPFCGAVERWRPLVREVLSEAWNEGRLDGARVDDDLVLALILRESTGDPRAIGVGGEGEVGLLQLMPGTFLEMLGRTPTQSDASGESLVSAMQDPRANVVAGVRYLARAVRAQDDDFYWGLIAYRAGMDAAGVWRRTGREPAQLRWPELAGAEIEAHVRATLETYARHRPDVRLVVLPAPGGPSPLVKPVLPAGQC